MKVPNWLHRVIVIGLVSADLGYSLYMFFWGYRKYAPPGYYDA